MQVRRIGLVVCLLVGMTAGAVARVPGRAHRLGRLDDGILETILQLITLSGQLSIPPG